MASVSCKFCSDRKINVDAKFTTLDERMRHAEFHALKLGYTISETEKDQAYLKLVFAECFPSESYEKSVEKLKDIEKSRSSLMVLCQRIINAKKNETNSIECHECGSKVHYTRMDGFGQKPDSILNHACHHSMKKPFGCRKCHSKLATKWEIARHVKEVHQIASPNVGVHFDEHWTECFDEIKDLLTKCFGGSLTKPRPKIPSTPANSSVLRRSIFMNIFKDVSEVKKIHCDRCKREICVSNRFHLEQHISTHLQRTIYECMLCDDYYVCHKSTIISHLTKNHGVQPKGNYIDHSDEYHGEIMDWVEKCFGKKVNK